MLKKIIAGLAAAIMTISAVATVSYADPTYEITLDTGVTQSTGVDQYGSQYFTVRCDDLVGSYTSALQIWLKVTSANKVKTDKANNFEYGISSGDAKIGMYVPGRSKTYLADSAFTQNVLTEDDGEQYIKVSWGSTTPVKTDDGVLFEFYVTPEDASKDVTFAIAYGLVNTCTSTNGDKVDHVADVSKAPEYKLAAGTSTISEVKGGDAEITPVITPGAEQTDYEAAAAFTGYAAATKVGSFTGDDNADDKATAFKATVSGTSSTGDVVWKVTDGTDTKYHKMSTGATFAGEGSAIVGLAVEGLADGSASVAFLK